MSETVLIKIPARPEFVATVRAATRSASALADLPVTDVEELQIAVDEAATLLLPLVDPSGAGHLDARFTVGDGALAVTLSAECVPDSDIDRAGMAWLLLTGLDPEVEVHTAERVVSISIERQRSDIEQ
ncbi:MAG: hypothetical protein NVSMB48_08520 [Marmoricola sp.]